MSLDWLPLLFKGRIHALCLKKSKFQALVLLQLQENILALTRCNIFCTNTKYLQSQNIQIILVTYINFPVAFRCYNSKQIDKSLIFHWSNFFKLPCGKFWKIFKNHFNKIYERNWSILSLKNKYLNFSN